MSAKNRKTARIQSSSGYPFLKLLLSLILGGFLAFLLVYQSARWIRHAPYFYIKKITCSAPSKAEALKRFGSLRHQSIFDVDLASLHKQVVRLFPEATDIRVMKRFPDEIYIDLKDRVPFAIVVFSDQRVTVDQSGYVTTKHDGREGTLPLVYGMARPNVFSMGQSILNPQLKMALHILEVFNKNRISASFQIVRINVENLSKISVFLSEQLEVFLDREAIAKQMEMLNIILNKAKLDWERIRSIDLRFSEPVIKYRYE